jgi:hypothetical protein
MKTLTEKDTFAPELRRTLEATRRALPGAEARARMYVQAGRAANSDEAASASLAYGLAAATIEACEQMLAQLNDSRPYWEVILPTASGEDGISPVYHDDSTRLYAYYPSGRMVRLRARLSDLHDFAIVEVEAEDGRSLGSGHIRERAAEQTQGVTR